MLRIINGDVTESDADYICHQVNCRNVMGAGVAKAISEKFPAVKKEYHKLCNSVSQPSRLLGQIQIVKVSPFTSVVNIFGQLNYGRGAVNTDYEALATAFKELNRIAHGKTVAMPYKIGCGLAGGSWEVVESLILDTLIECDVILYKKEQE